MKEFQKANNLKSCKEKRTMKGLRRNDDAMKNRSWYQNKIFIFSIALLFCINSFGQYNATPPPTYTSNANAQPKGYHQENVFIGGSLQLGYADNTFSIGGNPEIGYSFAQWLDGGISFNLNYSSQAADPNYFYNDDERTRQFNYGAGIFARVYPVRFLFFQLQPEINWIHQSITDYSTGEPIGESGTFQSTSLIAGIGYTQRIVGRGSFFTMIGLDILDNPNSPYREYNVDGSTSPIPIIRAGFDFYLHPPRK